MYTSVNKDLIHYDFNPSAKVKVFGDDLLYLVEMLEYKKNQQSPLMLANYSVRPNGLGLVSEFSVPIQFYYDFEIVVSKLLPEIGIQKIFTHRYNDAGKLVRFNLHTEDVKEAIIWYNRVVQYQKLHMCEIYIDSYFSEVQVLNKSKYKVDGLNFYKTYNIGRFPKASKDFKTRHTSEHGHIRYGYWKSFWSYEHPRDWKNLTSQEIADDILGLS